MESHLRGKGILNKKILIAAIMVSLMVVGVVFTQLQKTVVIAYEGQEIQVSTLANTVEGALRSEGLKVAEEDKVIPGLSEKIKDGTRIVIHRAFEIKLVDSGEEKLLLTAEDKVENVLKSFNIQLNEYDVVEPGLDAPLREGDVIKITRVEKEYLVDAQEIPFQTVIKYNDALDYGKFEKIQDGEKGLKEVKVAIVFEDGVEVAREIVEESIIKEAKHEVIERGTANYIVTSRGETRRYTQVITMTATGYDAGFESTGKRPGDLYYGVTRSGTRVRPGVVAVDPKVIPLGTKLYIESTDGSASYGYASAEDTGGAIKGNKIDLYFENRKDALSYGRRTVKVYVLE